MLEKKTREVTSENWETVVETYVLETITVSNAIEWNLDQLDSQITQKQNAIAGIQAELAQLEEKKALLLS